MLSTCKESKDPQFALECIAVENGTPQPSQSNGLEGLAEKLWAHLCSMLLGSVVVAVACMGWCCYRFLVSQQASGTTTSTVTLD